MKAVVDRFGEEVHAYLVLEGLALGHVYHRAVGVKRYRVTAARLVDTHGQIMVSLPRYMSWQSCWRHCPPWNCQVIRVPR